MRSCGGILISRPDETVAVLYDTVRQIYELPKGRQEQGETLSQTAAREVFEETGYKNHIGDSKQDLVGAIVRRHPKGPYKVVHWYICDLLETKSDHITGTQDVGESFITHWMSVAQAIEVMRYPTQAELLRHAMHRLFPRKYEAPTVRRGASVKASYEDIIALDSCDVFDRDCVYLHAGDAS